MKKGSNNRLWYLENLKILISQVPQIEAVLSFLLISVGGMSARGGTRQRERECLLAGERKKKLELGWVARRCWHSTGHGQINPDHVTLSVGVLAGPRNNRIARRAYESALLRSSS